LISYQLSAALRRGRSGPASFSAFKDSAFKDLTYSNSPIIWNDLRLGHPSALDPAEAIAEDVHVMRKDTLVGRTIPCSAQKIPCFSSEQGIASKALGLLTEMPSGRAKSIKKGQRFAKFPVLFPVLRESRASRSGAFHRASDAVSPAAGGDAPWQ
jgi:hypothetical protein